MISVLLVEDDEDLGDLLQELFAQVGWTVRIERNGFDALRSLETHTPDVIVTDGMMPQMGGREFMEKLRAQDAFKTVPVILMSGADGLLAAGTAERSWQATVRKPFDPDALVHLVLKLARPASTPPPITPDDPAT